jgi:hypothetical protein
MVMKTAIFNLPLFAGILRMPFLILPFSRGGKRSDSGALPPPWLFLINGGGGLSLPVLSACEGAKGGGVIIWKTSPDISFYLRHEMPPLLAEGGEK